MALALKIGGGEPMNGFAGMIPKLDNRILPDKASAQATNTYFYNGKLEGMVEATFLRTLSDPSAVFAYRIPLGVTDMAHAADSLWLEFDDINTNVIKPAFIADQFQRYYWASPSGQPKYNTFARIQAGNTSPNNPLLLGVPRPANAPGLTPTGGTAVDETRAYVYTWVTAYGEEGQPSPPALATAFEDATWGLTFTAPATNDTNGVNRFITTTNIYRTITGTDGTTTFFFVASVPVATLSYNDTASDTTVSANNELVSTNWSGPPTTLQGWVTLPNGMIAGWDTEANVWFCEPYRPHAWPSIYTVAVDYPIVGLGVSGQTLVICTEVQPYWGTGINPASFALSKMDSTEPCLSRGSIMSAPEGVYYASPNGLILAQSGVVVNISRQYMLKDNWLNLAKINTIHAARLGTGYYAWGTGTQGIFASAFAPEAFAQSDLGGAREGLLIDPIDQSVLVSQLSNDDPTYNTFNDPWTGEVFIIRDGAVNWLNIADLNPTRESYFWRSKLFQAPNKRNIGAMKIYFDIASTLPVLSATPVTNLVELETLQSNQWGIVRLYADEQLVWARELRDSGELMKLPSGFKADFYQLEIEARVTISNIQVAETSRELAKV